MIVVTKDGFVHLSGCYEIQCHFNEFDEKWRVLASWTAEGGSTLYTTPYEDEARKIVTHLSRTAWGDGDKERRVAISDILTERVPLL